MDKKIKELAHTYTYRNRLIWQLLGVKFVFLLFLRSSSRFILYFFNGNSYGTITISHEANGTTAEERNCAQGKESFVQSFIKRRRHACIPAFSSRSITSLMRKLMNKLWAITAWHLLHWEFQFSSRVALGQNDEESFLLSLLMRLVKATFHVARA